MYRSLHLLALALASVAAGPAVSLQNSAGQELLFLKLAINVAVVGPFALVENEMVFQNPEDRRMEGRFSFLLPVAVDGQAAMPSRFAMQVGDRLMEGEVVNRSKAQLVYREILHEARDPALLEQSQGNVFSARVFPIEPRALVRLILSYAISLPLRSWHRSLVLPLAGLPEIRNLSVALGVRSLSANEGFSANCSMPQLGQLPGATAEGGLALRFAGQVSDVVPTRDLELDIWEPSAASRSFAVGEGQLVTTFVVENATAASGGTAATRWTVYIDTSASVADTFLVRLPMIQALLEALPAAVTELQVFAFDIEVAELLAPSAPQPGTGAAVRQALAQRLPAGATDLELLLQHAEASEAAGPVLILSDFIPTVKERAAQKLGQLLTSNRSVYLGVMGTKFDAAVGTAVASAGNGRVVFMPLSPDPTALAPMADAAWKDILKPQGLQASLEVPSGWLWPQAGFDLHQGDELVVYSGGAAGAVTAPPGLALGGQSAPSAPGLSVASEAYSALLLREAARARLEMLEAQRQLAERAEANQLKEQIIALSEQKRVMTQHTALLVLETDEDYVRFGIPQDRLSPILVVEPGGVTMRKREDIVLSALPSPIEVEIDFNFSNSSNSSEQCEQGFECNLRLDDGDIMVLSERVEGSMSGAAGQSRPYLWILLLVFCFWPSFATWVDLDAHALKVFADQNNTSPTVRQRTVASDYAGALWTKNRAQELKSFCSSWIMWDPSNSLAYEFLSKAAAALDDPSLALRAMTSIVEIAPRDSEQLLRGAWLSLASEPPLPVWAQRFGERSLSERQDNANTYRALAMAYWQDQNFQKAAEVYSQALQVNFDARYGNVHRVLREEAMLLLRQLRASDSAAFQKAKEVFSWADWLNVDEGADITLMITLSWLTDANDVDLHVIDPNKEECYYGNRLTAWGLELYSDQTQGLGPELISLTQAKKGTYQVGVKYFSTGAMGASRGSVVIRKLASGLLTESKVLTFTLPSGLSGVLPVTTVVV